MAEKNLNDRYGDPVFRIVDEPGEPLVRTSEDAGARSRETRPPGTGSKTTSRSRSIPSV